MVVIGVDIGSVATKGILISDGVQHKTIFPTGWSPRDASDAVIAQLLHQSGIEGQRVTRIFGTGYGRVAFDQADKTVTEIKCHARGIAELLPEVRTIIDIGGQDSKVIRIGERGQVVDFSMNDKCAAGTGRFLQVMATALGLDVSELGAAEDPAQRLPISSMCTVFAESEIIGLMAKGNPKGGIVAGLHQSVGKRVAAMAKRLGIKEPIAFTGGVAINQGVKRALEEELGAPVMVSEACQYTGALGAALLALENV
ncbi:MAG: 2-hydroxyglutaryl-CoA dehydratase [Syntrophomonadaceae bacterium]|nr:2-hydroxyglutaryl-CoA dehydratase [Syntrophomonadaceae bacterium]